MVTPMLFENFLQGVIMFLMNFYNTKDEPDNEEMPTKKFSLLCTLVRGFNDTLKCSLKMILDFRNWFFRSVETQNYSHCQIFFII